MDNKLEGTRVFLPKVLQIELYSQGLQMYVFEMKRKEEKEKNSSCK